MENNLYLDVNFFPRLQGRIQELVLVAWPLIYIFFQSSEIVKK